MRLLLPFLLLSLFLNAQTKTVVVLPSKDTTVVTFTATATASNTISSSIAIHQTKVPPVNPPPDTTVVTPSDHYGLIYSNGFNKTSDMDPFGHNQQGKGFINFSVFTEGLGSFDSRPATVSQGERSEASLDPETPLEGAVDYWVYYNYVVKDQCHDIQWHPSTSGGSASPGGWHVNGKLVFRNWTSKTGNVDHPTGLTLQTNTWYHFRIEYKFGSNGYFRHYTNGQMDCSWTGQVGDGSSPYFKLGFNGAFLGDKAEADKSDILYDDLKVYKYIP